MAELPKIPIPIIAGDINSRINELRTVVIREYKIQMVEPGRRATKMYGLIDTSKKEASIK
jgi:hypothetical protein